MAVGLSRVTIVAPHTRVDLALPADVPLADLLPTLLGFTGSGADEAARRNGWSLSRLGGGELDSSSTAAQLEVRDGELLYLRPRGDEDPVVVFDDLVDAVATGTRDRLGRWTTGTTRTVGLLAGVIALLAGAIAVPLAGPPLVTGGLIGLGLALALLVAALVFARALGDTRAATAFALVATVYAGIGGLLVLAEDRTLSQLGIAHVAVAGTAAAIAATVASLAIPGAAPVFLAAGACAGAVLLTTGITAVLGLSVAAAAAITVTISYALLPALPMFAYRLSGLPIPTVPTEREQMRQDVEKVDGLEVLRLSGRADAYLNAMVTALAIISAAAAWPIATTGGGGLAMCGVLALLPLVRARWFGGQAARFPLLFSGGLALTILVVTIFDLLDRSSRLVGIFGGSVVVAALSIAFSLTGGRRSSSPFWGRLLDVFEVVLILALIPLAVLVSGGFEWIRSVRG